MFRLTILALLTLSACGGEMRGAVQSPEGQPLGAARAEYTDNGFGSGTIRVFMPDGETFDGSWTETAAQSDSWGRVGDESYYTFGTTRADLYSAALIGDRDHSMQCLFHGAGGRCQVSDGRTVDVTW